MSKYAYVTFIIRNDSFVPGALVFAYSLRKQQTPHELVCMITEDVSDYAKATLEVMYDHVLSLPTLYVPHARRHERQDRPFLFTRFHAFRLGKDGDLSLAYDKIIMADADVLPLKDYDSLFQLDAPAGILNERKEYTMEYDSNLQYTIPQSVKENGEWKWHKVYKAIPHGTKIPAYITDRVMEDSTNMGVNTSVVLLKPSLEMFESIVADVSQEKTKQTISQFNWPEMQYITYRYSGMWSNIDLKYSSFNGYPGIEYIKGIHFAGLKPWQINHRSIKNFAKFEDYRLWYHVFKTMCKEVPKLLENKRMKRLYNTINKLTSKEKYQFERDYLPNLSHLFR